MAAQKILIVDDDPIVLKLLQHDLAGAGYDVLPADTGQKAVRLAQFEQPDLIILDIMMPGMNGGDAAEKLGGDGRTSNIPIIYLSSLVTKEDEDSKEGSPQVVLAKPYTLEKFLQAVHDNIRPARARVV